MKKQIKKQTIQNLYKAEGLIYLEGLIFLEKKLFKLQSPIVQLAFEPLYAVISKN
jgi:hypothetical protein